MELAGFLAAHGMWSFDEDGALTPMAGYETADGARGIVRFLEPTLEEGVAAGHEYLDGNWQGASMAVMVSDGAYEAEGQQVQALIVEGRSYSEPAGALAIAVPYHAATAEAGPQILFPELLRFEVEGAPAEQFDLLGAFFEGLESHGPAAEFWDAHARFERPSRAAAAL
jgi:hypothetical protein